VYIDWFAFFHSLVFFFGLLVDFVSFISVFAWLREQDDVRRVEKQEDRLISD